jgi:hypothetical protein
MSDIARQGVYLAQYRLAVRSHRNLKKKVVNQLRLAVNDELEERALAMPLA